MSAIKDVFKNITAVDSRREISKELINSEDNLSVKTDIDSVSTFAVLETITYEVEQQKLAKTTETLKKFTDFVYRLSLSKNRQSRSEYIEAIKGLSAFQTENNSESRL